MKGQRDRGAEGQRGGRTHAIRLNSAWELRLLDESLGDAPDFENFVEQTTIATRINLPWSDAEEVGAKNSVAMILTRRFNRPSNLAIGQSVTLFLDGLPSDAVVYFNSEAVDFVSGQKTASLPIGDRLRGNNRIDLVLADFEFLSQANVRLEIADP